MSDLTGNKIIAAALGTAFSIAVLNVVPGLFFHKTPPEKAGFKVAVKEADAGGGADAPEVPPDWGTVLKTADVSAGESKAAVCKSCHVLDSSGANLIGPGLWGVVGRKPGSHPGFSYSSGMTAFGGKQPVWDYDHLYGFLHGPAKYVEGTKMAYAGIKDSQDRINVIAYLHTLGSSLPVPAPKPAAAPATPATGAAAAAPAAAAPAGAAPTAPAAKTAA